MFIGTCLMLLYLLCCHKRVQVQSLRYITAMRVYNLIAVCNNYPVPIRAREPRLPNRKQSWRQITGSWNSQHKWCWYYLMVKTCIVGKRPSLPTTKNFNNVYISSTRTFQISIEYRQVIQKEKVFFYIYIQKSVFKKPTEISGRLLQTK